MSLSKKYGIPEETIKLMVRDGWISCSAFNYQEIYITYKRELESGKPKNDAIHIAAEQSKVSDRVVYTVIKKFE